MHCTSLVPPCSQLGNGYRTEDKKNIYLRDRGGNNIRAKINNIQ